MKVFISLTKIITWSNTFCCVSRFSSVITCSIYNIHANMEIVCGEGEWVVSNHSNHISVLTVQLPVALSVIVLRKRDMFKGTLSCSTM